MSASDQHLDELLDAGLRSVGPQIPEPRVSPEARARIGALLDADATSAASTPRAALPARPTRAWPIGVRRVTPYLSLGLAATALWLAFSLVGVQRENAELRGELDRLTVALVGDLSPYHAGPVADSARLVVVNLHSSKCPRARRVTPAFEKLAAEHAQDPIAFVTLDVNCDRSPAAASLMGIDCVFDQKCCGSETGTVKVVDRASHSVLLTAVGTDELDRVEKLIRLSCVGGEDPRELEPLFSK